MNDLLTTLALMKSLSLEERWEDQERGNYDADALREEFRQRLYADAPLELTTNE